MEPNYAEQARAYLDRANAPARAQLEGQMEADLMGHYFLGQPLSFQDSSEPAAPPAPAGNVRRGWAVLAIYALAIVGAVTILRAVF